VSVWKDACGCCGASSFVGIGGFEKQYVRFLKVLKELMKICEAKSATRKVGALSSEM